MLKATTFALAVALTSTAAYAEQAPITGTVQSKCTIVTTRTGVYAQPTPDVLTTASASGFALCCLCQPISVTTASLIIGWQAVPLVMAQQICNLNGA